jgi:hypothetical protein
VKIEIETDDLEVTGGVAEIVLSFNGKNITLKKELTAAEADVLVSNKDKAKAWKGFAESIGGTVAKRPTRATKKGDK